MLGIVIALFWLVGITNALNLLDNMDGLAATLTTVACLYFAIDAATVHENDLVLVLSLSLGVRVPRLPAVQPPARRRRARLHGRRGSQVLGFLLAALGLASSWTTAGTTVATMLLPLLVLAIPILDTTLVTIRRLAERRPVTQGGTDHTSHRLVYYGLSETKAVALLALIAVALGATSVAYNVLDRPAVTALGVLVTFALLVQFGSFLAELSEQERRGKPGDTRLRHAVTVQPRRFVELLVDSSLVCGTFLVSYVALRRRPRHRAAARHVPRGAAGAAGHDVRRVRPVRHLPARVAVRDAARPGHDRSRVRHRDARRVRDRRGDAEPRRLPGARLPSLRRSSPRCSRRSRAGASGSSPRLDGGRTTAGGASSSSAQAPRDAASSATSRHDVRVVGFLDDNPRLLRRRVQGVPVLGPLDETGTAIETSRADEVVVTIPEAPADRLDLVIQACAKAGVPQRVFRERPTLAPAPTRAIAE